MRGHKIRHKVLLFAQLFIYFIVFIAELLVNVKPGFAHIGENLGRDMLGSNFQLS